MKLFISIVIFRMLIVNGYYKLCLVFYYVCIVILMMGVVKSGIVVFIK